MDKWWTVAEIRGFLVSGGRERLGGFDGIGTFLKWSLFDF